MIRTVLCVARTACIALPALTTSALAETDFSNLTASERVIFHAAIREALLEVPQLLPGASALVSPPTPLQEEITNDLARIKANAKRLFDPALPGFGPEGAKTRIALFISEGCGSACTEAETDLRALSERTDMRVTLIRMEDAPDLAAALEIDTVPFYVFPDKFLRGQMPLVVLERYIAQ